MNTWQRSAVVALGGAMVAASADAAVVRLKMSEINPGTEVVNTTLSTGGGFNSHENLNADTPRYWQRWEEAMVTRAPINAPAGADLGSWAAQVLPNYAAGMNPGGYARFQKLPSDTYFWQGGDLQPNTRYVLSAYVWNFGSATDHVTARIDLTDKPNEPQLILNWDDEDADLGYFMYGSFSTDPNDPDYIGNHETLRPPVRVWALNRSGYVGAGSTVVAAQFDNVFITPEADFRPPTLAPEPAAASMLGLAAIGFFSRRRREGAAGTL